MPELPLSEIQGFILRGYGMSVLRIFPLTIERPAQAGEFLGSLVNADATTPKLTTAERTTRPDYAVNIGFTHAGLGILGLPESSAKSFPAEFRLGAAQRAERVGDTGASAPALWEHAFKPDTELHALLFLFARNDEARDRLTSHLRAGMRPGFKELASPYDSSKLPNKNEVHFGFRDGLSQPRIKGAPVLQADGVRLVMEDLLPESQPGEFLLGYPSQFEGHTYPVPEPEDELGRNGSFMAFRLLHQDCDAFEDFLTTASRHTGLPTELIAAKLCGRWRNGMPLSLSPHDQKARVPEEKWNSFDFVPTSTTTVDDADGRHCPIGSHIRRMNPRHARVAGATGLKRRIVRRGMPFGPPHKLGDGETRGLLGLFICVSLQDQFEFIMSEWTNSGAFVGGTDAARDPIHGDHSTESSSNRTFRFPNNGQTVELQGLSRFVTCRGAAYCFLPSVTAIQHLAKVAAGSM